MKKILGIDYGKKKIGLAIAVGSLAEVYGVIRFETTEEALQKLMRVIEKESIKQIVLGISEGKMAEETKRFGESLFKKTQTPVVFWDETLTTQDAQRLSIEAGIKRKKRKELEDAYSAALILQNYLDVQK